VDPIGMSHEQTRRVRLEEPDRSQATMTFAVPDDAIGATHAARVIWNVIGTLDLSKFLVGVKSVEGTVGRKTKSLRMKLTLWLYAIAQGVGSARHIEQLTRSDVAYRWIVGDVSIGHHTLSSFRAEQGVALDQVMTDILASLIHKGVLSLDLVAQDGIRIRAAATAPSFRRLPSLLECREQAALHLKATLAQADDPELTRAQKARREAAALDFQRRVEDAIATVTELQAKRSASDKAARASTTDAEARVMKMADGGFRPAYNVQMVTAGSPMGGPRTVVGVRVTNVGSDMGSITPMLEQVEQRTGILPKVLLADANHAKHECIRAATEKGVEVLIAVPAREANQGPNVNPEEAIAAWRARMETEEAKTLYRARASLCELSNAHFRTLHGVDHFLVRGIAKVTCVALLAGIAANILQHATALLA
jgi:transposase